MGSWDAVTRPSLKRAALVQSLLDAKGLHESALPIVPLERGGSLPLSFAQERMWLLEQIEGAGNTRNLPAVVRLQGDLNVAALEQAVAALIERHETLRTRIAMVDGQAVQAIDGFAPVALAVDDVSGPETAEEIEGQARRIVLRETSRPFELTRE